jgi:Kef-type K+ transport system membrane component KefB
LKKVLIYSILLVAGLALSQYIPNFSWGSSAFMKEFIRLATVFCLGFIMIHVGYEFEIDRSRLRSYALDYGVAATAAAFPWIFAALYFVFILNPSTEWGNFTIWKESLLASRFAAPTSAGILFSMLAAAGLSATWVFRKLRVLAIFDDLDTVLLMIPLKMLIVGLKWQLGVVIIIMFGLLWLAWRYLHVLRLPISWPFVMAYSMGLTIITEVIYLTSKLIDEVVSVHIEILLPAFVLGCMLARPKGNDPHIDDLRNGHQEGPESSGEQKVAGYVSGAFMLLVGLSMPPIRETLGGNAGYGWGTIVMHVLLITALVNLGKMFPLFVYKKESTWRERLAISIGMWPRGEVGAGVLIISLSYGIGGIIVTVAMISLALNLLLTGLFIVFVKKLLAHKSAQPDPALDNIPVNKPT